jgi:pentafunctional AROM polypeptide
MDSKDIYLPFLSDSFDDIAFLFFVSFLLLLLVFFFFNLSGTYIHIYIERVASSLNYSTFHCITMTDSSNKLSAVIQRDPISVTGYHAHVGRGLLASLADRVSSLVPKANTFVIITDDNVRELYGLTLLDSFNAFFSLDNNNDEDTEQLQTPKRAVLLAVPPGEWSKNRSVKAGLEADMLRLKCGRDTCIVALGGGVVGDLGGFVAATYMRGVPFVQVPTSFLAMVDSSIGGKTGIDTPAGKNLVGAFYRPKAVFADINVLQTLPRRELFNGLAESIKAGAIFDEALFEFIEQNELQIQGCNLDVLAHIVYESVRIKAHVVKADEKEGGMRAILNFGHTIGHAVEAMKQPDLLHGECVAIGMIAEAELARFLGFLHTSAIRRLDNVCRVFGLPVAIPDDLTAAELLERMSVDKKNIASRCHIVMLTSIGTVRSHPWATAVDHNVLRGLVSSSITLKPSCVDGTVLVPGSKSVSNRVLLLAALGKGTCHIRGLLHSDDTQVMLASLRHLGVQYEWQDNQATLVMHGTEGKLQVPALPLMLNNAGTAARFLTTVCTLVPNGVTSVTGNHRMLKRPIGDLVDALSANGSKIEYAGESGHLPLIIHGATDDGKFGLNGGTIELSAGISSQYVSSILISAPYARTPVKLVLTGDRVVSAPYIEMTLGMMEQFGAVVSRPAPFTYVVQNTGYKNPTDFLVEGDASSATYPLAMAAITGGRVTIGNVGSMSRQGDAAFCQLLSKMGCTVKQDETTTTVQGPPPGTLKALGEVDLDSMTDSFMTLAAVAVFASGVTSIINIANQRVKECNRIEAMITELTKCGVTVRELPSGIEIVGTNGTDVKLQSACIECYDDHRIAMSFAVVGCVVPRITITDKACVGKTYPEFWDHCRRELSLSTVHIQATHDAGSRSSSNAYRTILQSMVIIGMRGAGKTYFGRSAAQSLGIQFFDLDHELEREIADIKQFVAEHGWPEFRRRELAVFRRVTEAHPHNAIISCGGGIVETAEAYNALCRMNNVVFIDRHIDDIVEYLSKDGSRPSLGDDLRQVYARRLPLFRTAGDSEFYIRQGDNDWEALGRDFGAFACTIRGQAVYGGPRHRLGDGSFFLSLTYPDLKQCVGSTLDTISRGVDALELRVDLLADTSVRGVSDQLALLRRHSRLPIIFTVRTAGQGGRFPDVEPAVFELLQMGARQGCQFIDVECHWSAHEIQRLVKIAKNNHAEILSSVHVPHSNGGSTPQLLSLFQRCALGGMADVVKVVVLAGCVDDALRLLRAASEWRESSASAKSKLRPEQRLISLAMGLRGQVSRVLNQALTPVTHPALPASAAPGQLSAEAIQKQRSAMGVIDSRQFYLFGSPISKSPSPLMHNSGFEHCLLPHHYDLYETTDIKQVSDIIARPDFGGSSVTIPLKQEVVPLMDELSPSAAKIGAVNTVVKTANGRLIGHNTDWVGIARPLLRLLGGERSTGTGCAVVVGAGGTARAALYAMSYLGYNKQCLVVHNPRTPSKADALAQEFHCTSGIDGVLAGLANGDEKSTAPQCNATDEAAAQSRVDVIVVTVPGTAAYQVPMSILDQQSPPVVVDVAYLPKKSAVSEQALAHNCPLVRGIDMLIGQGIEAFKIWTGRDCAAECMDAAVRTAYAKMEE